MSIELTPDLEQLVHGIYAGGQYASEKDVLATALMLLQSREQLRQDLELGCRELYNGERLDADEVFLGLKQRAAELDGRGA